MKLRTSIPTGFARHVVCRELCCRGPPTLNSNSVTDSIILTSRHIRGSAANCLVFELVRCHRSANRPPGAPNTLLITFSCAHSPCLFSRSVEQLYWPIIENDPRPPPSGPGFNEMTEIYLTLSLRVPIVLEEIE